MPWKCKKCNHYATVDELRDDRCEVCGTIGFEFEEFELSEVGK